MQGNNKSYYKAFINFATFSFVIVTFLWFYSPFANLDWGQWKVPKFQNMYPFVTLSLAIIALFVFKREVKFVKSQQLNKDYQLIIKYLEMRIRELTTKLNFAEEKTNRLLSRLQYLNQLATMPELALYLIEKILNTVEQYNADLSIHVDGSLDSLKSIQVEDLKQSIELILEPVYSNFNNTEEDSRRDINLFIREEDNKVSLKIMHDYVGSPINTDVVEWNVKKLLHKYGANFTVENEKEEESELYVLSLAIDIPKENRTRKVG